MNYEPSLQALLEAYAPTFPGMAPEGTARPYIVYNQVGGVSPANLCGGADGQNARVQINLWCDTYGQAVTMMRAIQTALTSKPRNNVSLGNLVSDYNPATKAHGARQDFSIWYR